MLLWLTLGANGARLSGPPKADPEIVAEPIREPDRRIRPIWSVRRYIEPWLEETCYHFDASDLK